MPQSIRAESLRPSLLHNELHRWSRKETMREKRSILFFQPLQRKAQK